jgi:hypothetical protein
MLPAAPALPMFHVEHEHSTLPMSPLARIMHETLWRQRTDGRATGQPQTFGPEAHHSIAAGLSRACHGEAPPTQTRLAPEAGMVCPRSSSGTGAQSASGASTLLWTAGVTPALSTTSPPEALASLSTSKAAIPPRRDVFADLSRNPSGADLPATAYSSRLQAAPTGLLPTHSTAGRQGRPYPKSQRGSRA